MHDAEKAEIIERLNGAFPQFVPHNRALGMRFVDFDREAGVAVMSLPWEPHLVGNPDTGVLHGGVVTSLLDATCGAAVFVRMWVPIPIATLDLRIDYLRPATPRLAVVAKATCYKVTRHVAFLRALAFHDDEADPIASAAGAFMLSTKGSPAVRVEGGPR